MAAIRLYHPTPTHPSPPRSPEMGALLNGPGFGSSGALTSCWEGINGLVKTKSITLSQQPVTSHQTVLKGRDCLGDWDSSKAVNTERERKRGKIKAGWLSVVTVASLRILLQEKKKGFVSIVWSLCSLKQSYLLHKLPFHHQLCVCVFVHAWTCFMLWPVQSSNKNNLLYPIQNLMCS